MPKKQTLLAAFIRKQAVHINQRHGALDPFEYERELYRFYKNLNYP